MKLNFKLNILFGCKQKDLGNAASEVGHHIG